MQNNDDFIIDVYDKNAEELTRERYNVRNLKNMRDYERNYLKVKLLARVDLLKRIIKLI
mgnify:CR=1 FL=1